MVGWRTGKGEALHLWTWVLHFYYLSINWNLLKNIAMNCQKHFLKCQLDDRKRRGGIAKGREKMKDTESELGTLQEYQEKPVSAGTHVSWGWKPTWWGGSSRDFHMEAAGPRDCSESRLSDWKPFSPSGSSRRRLHHWKLSHQCRWLLGIF